MILMWSVHTDRNSTPLIVFGQYPPSLRILQSCVFPVMRKIEHLPKEHLRAGVSTMRWSVQEYGVQNR